MDDVRLALPPSAVEAFGQQLASAGALQQDQADQGDECTAITATPSDVDAMSRGRLVGTSRRSAPSLAAGEQTGGEEVAGREEREPGPAEEKPPKMISCEALRT